jgi:hypothetical protein
MRILAIIANAIFMGAVTVAFVTEADATKTSEWLVLLLILVTPALSIVALLLCSGKSWISLWCERKALEEKKKIENMRSENA